jgi:hypothetical protein
MRCEGCGFEAPALKTVRWKTGDRRFVLCDPCWLAIRGSVWIVVGPTLVFGKCRGCSHWFSLRDLSGRRPGGRWDSPEGICAGCAGG